MGGCKCLKVPGVEANGVSFPRAQIQFRISRVSGVACSCNEYKESVSFCCRRFVFSKIRANRARCSECTLDGTTSFKLLPSIGIGGDLLQSSSLKMHRALYSQGTAFPVR